MNEPLSQIPTERLAQELARRSDLRNDDGLLTPDIFRLRAKLGPIVCTDGIPMRQVNGVIEGGIIRRNTGPYRGTFSIIGGVIGYGETIENALRRHFRTDIGMEIEFLNPLGIASPAGIFQYHGPKSRRINSPALPLDIKPRGKGGEINEHPPFLPEPTKHAVALTYLVTIPESAKPVFGSSPFGQEASEFVWHSLETCPPEQEFGYGTHNVFLECMSEAAKLLNPK